MKEPREKTKMGVLHYGNEFAGYMKLPEIVKDIPAFKDFYIARKRLNPDMSNIQICRAFNEEVMYPQGMRFHPHQTHLSQWAEKWEGSTIPDSELIAGDVLVPPTDAELEVGMRMLGGDLLKDASSVLNEATGDDSEMSLKQRTYVVSVFSHITKMVHGKANIMLKQSEEKRNTASFLMSLLSKATAGTITDDEISVLESSYQPKEQDVEA